MSTAGSGPTGVASSKTTGGRRESSSNGRAAKKLAEAGIQLRAYSAGLQPEYLADLAPHTADLARLPRAGSLSGRSQTGRNQAGLRRDPARLVRKRAGASAGRKSTEVDAGRRTRLRPGTCPRLAAWLHRVARVHAHLCAIVRLYGNPNRAGGQSLQGETYAARAARGDRTLLYDAVGLSIDELTEIRNEIQAVLDAAEPTAAGPGTADKVAEMARRAERGESLFVDGDGPRPGDGSPG